ncbi:MAG: methionine--tRNA ligase [Pseudomonadota bacterium]
MASRPTYYVTTPIYYVNDKPHIGHAYTTLACDALARFMRLDGYDVMFLTGTDEHGQKVQKSAQAAGVDTTSFTDQVSQNFRDLAVTLNVSNDDFIRTTEDRHHRATKAIWKSIETNDDIYLGSYAGWYSVRDEAYFTESELTKSDGKMLAPSGAECEWVEEESYFFKLSAYQDKLLKHYADNPDFILPETRRNEVVSFVSSGLKDLSISRTTFDWGVQVPGNEKHVVYVWLDALTNYMTAVGYPEGSAAPDWRYWPADLHMVGKDILRFHAVYWPAFLMSAGLPLPKRIFAHGWWTNEGQKISKSLGNVIDPLVLVDRFGLDQVRYFLLREVPFGNDGDFSERAMINRTNGDLANDLGNLAQRVLSMIAKNCNGVMPARGEDSDADKTLLASAGGLANQLRQAYASQAFHRALEAEWAVIAEANRYVDDQAPWALRKTDPERMAHVLAVLAEVIRHLAILVQPVMPDSANRLLDQLGVDAANRTIADLTPEQAVSAGTELPKPQGVFPRYVEEALAG